MPELVPFKVGEAAPANTFLAIWMAAAASFYEANGLKANIVHVVGGRESGPDLTSGHIDLMHIGMSSVVRARTAGYDVVTIGSLSNTIRNTLFGAPKVKTAADLKGRTVGISSAGSETDSTTTLSLRKLGLKREDVTIKEIGVDRLAAVRDAEVSASMLGEPHRSQAFALGLNPLVDLFEERTPWLYSGLVVHRQALRERRDLVLSFMRATIEGNYLAASEAEKAKAVLASQLKLTDPAIVDQSYALFRAETPLNCEMTRDGAKNIVDVTDISGASRNIDDYMDASVSDELRASGFFGDMKRKYPRAGN